MTALVIIALALAGAGLVAREARLADAAELQRDDGLAAWRLEWRQ